MRSILPILVTLGLIFSFPTSPALGSGPDLPAATDVETFVLFDPTVPENPESILVDRNGDLLVAFAFTGEIRRITPEGEQSTVAFVPIAVQTLVPCQVEGFPGVLGAIVQDRRGNIFANAAACEDENRGVWKIDPEGNVSLVANLPAGSLPNGITLARGFLFVADSALGVIWRIPSRGGEPVVWADGPLLAEDPAVFAPGPNGIQVFRDEIYVANSDSAQIIAIPFVGRADAGEPRVHATLPFGCDDFTFDVLGNLYCTTDPANRVLRTTPDGETEIILDSDDLLDGPTAVAFGRRSDDRTSLYITNAAFPFFTVTNRPSIIRADVGIPGAPR